MKKWMKEQGRRSLSLLLAAVLVFCLFSGAIPAVFAAGESEAKYEGLRIAVPSSDVRVKLTDFPDIQDGQYIITFSFSDAIPVNWGFLARYKDESSYAGFCAASTTTMQAHYSQGLSNRGNVGSKSIQDLNTDTVYVLTLTYQGAVLKGKITTQDAPETELWSDEHTMTGTYYEGAGALAIRSNNGALNMLIKQIEYYAQLDEAGNPSGDKVTVDYTNYSGDTVNYEARANKSNAVNNGLATVELVPVTEPEPEPEPVEGPFKGNLTQIAGTQNDTYISSYDPFTDVYTSKNLQRWQNFHVWALDGVEDFKDGTITLTYVDNGVNTNPSDFGVVLRHIAAGELGTTTQNDKFLYIGYSGTSSTWFWQLRTGEAGGASNTTLNTNAPQIGGETKLELTVENGDITIKVNDVELATGDSAWASGSNNRTLKKALAEVLTTGGKVGIGSVSGGTTSPVANVTIHDFTVVKSDSEEPPVEKEPAPEKPEDDGEDVAGLPFDETVSKYRIPALVTAKGGTLVAAVDARWNSTADGGNHDTVVSISKDNGENWTYYYANYFNDTTDVHNSYGATFIDPALAYDKGSGTLYMLVDVFPGNTWNNQSKTASGSGYVAIGNSGNADESGTKRLVLYKSAVNTEQAAGWDYYVGAFNEDGGKKLAPVYAKGTTSAPAYYVDEWYYIYDTAKEPVYCDQLTTGTTTSGKVVHANVFFYNAPVHVLSTSYLWLTTSKDNGVNWSAPTMLNEMVKSDDEFVYLAGPGRGLVMEDGTVVFPCYTHSNSNEEHTSLIYLKDDEWQRTIDLPVASSEAAVVEAEGKIMVLARQASRIYQADSLEDVTVDEQKQALTREAEPAWTEGSDLPVMNHRTQISAITYSQTVDDKTAILLSGPSNSTGTQREKGRIWIGLVETDGTVTWQYEYEVTSGEKDFAYSCLTEMTKSGDDGKPMVALLWERNNEIASGAGATIGKTGFQTYELEELMTEQEEPEPDETLPALPTDPGPWTSGTADKSSGTGTASFSNETDIFTAEGIGKWADVPIWTLNGVDDFGDGTVTLTYADYGVLENGKVRPSDFGVFLRFTGSGNANDKFLYIGYNGNTLDNNDTADSYYSGWFWQYRYANGAATAGEFLDMRTSNSACGSSNGAAPAIGGELTTLKITLKGNTITVTVNGVTLTDHWEGPGGNSASNTLTGLLTKLPSAGKVGFGMISPAKPAAAQARVVVHEFSVEGEISVDALQALVTEAKTKNAADYSPASWEEFEKALEAAEEILEKHGSGDPTLTQSQVNEALSALQEAIRNLVLADAAADPGLPEAEHNNITRPDIYTQALQVGQTSSLGGSVVNINQGYWEMDGKALTVGGAGDDGRVEFVELRNGPANGAYELAIRIGAEVPSNSIGILVRYTNEDHYAGFSFDTTGLQAHYATGSGGRTNTALDGDYRLEANTTYKLRLEYNGRNMSLQVTKEGEDAPKTYSYQLSTSGVTDGGGFALRIRSNYVLQVDNVIQYKLEGNAYTEVKRLDFNDADPVASNFLVRQNRGTDTSNATVGTVVIPASDTVATFPAGVATKLTADSEKLFIDNASPETAGIIYTVQTAGDWSKLGLVFNYQDDSNYATIRFREGQWVLGGKVGGQEVPSVTLQLAENNWASSDITDPTGSETRTLRVDTSEDGKLTLYVSAGSKGTQEQWNSYTTTSTDGIFTGKGKVGLIGSGTIYAGPIEVIYDLEAIGIDPPAGSITIESDEMTVHVGENAPFIYKYETKDGKEVAYGTVTDPNAFGVKINDAVATVTTKLKENNGNSAVYTVNAAVTDAAAEFEVRLAVEGKVLTMTVLSVTESRGTVRTFQFTDPMLTFAGLGAEAALGIYNGWGPASDKFVALKGATGNKVYGDNPDSKPVDNMTYALLSDKASGTVGAMENNVESSEKKYNLIQNVTGEYPYLALVNTAWAWEYYANSNPDALKDDESAMYYDRLPYAKVVIGGDENGDGQITWQDAGIVYRDIMIKAYGSENVKNEWMFIAMNMSSQASQPFLRVLDLAKSISYMTDGFGFKIMNKGYQAGGHDDSHGDYKFVGDQQGGARDFNMLIEIGLLYGVKNGVHMNVTEFALDSTGAALGIMQRNGENLRPNWKWFDQAFLINKSTDVSTGALQQRISAAFGNDGAVGENGLIPKLDFAYVDVYQSGSNYNATQLVKYLNEAGLTVGTEALGDMNQGITFVHWNTDMYYAAGGGQSEVMRFVVQGSGDLNAPDRALLGSLMPGCADWRNVNNYAEAITVFYRENLATKYLQYFKLESWTPNEYAKLTNEKGETVVSSVEGNFTTITKDGKVIAKINTSNFTPYLENNGATPGQPTAAAVFIPWSPVTEDKIYYYSDLAAGSDITTWSVPETWKSVSTVYAYELTANGRADTPTTLTVSGGQVNVSSLSRSTPYILVKEKTTTVYMYDANGQRNGKTLPTLADHPYGEGTGIADPGFTSGTLEGWTVDGTNAEGVSIVSDNLTNSNGGSNGQGNGDPRVSIPANFKGTLSQQIQVEAGRPYTFSAWVYAPAGRDVTLRVESDGEVLKETTLSGTVVSGYTVSFRPSKFYNTQWQRMRLEGVTVPTGTVTLVLEFASGSAAAFVDDFRSWQWTTDVNPLTEKYYYYEDFENLDENWGPFVSLTNSQPLSHLAYSFDDQEQIKTFVLYDNTSLKGQEGGANNSTPKMRTIPSTLRFEAGTEYKLEFDYQTYRELKAAEDAGYAGYNVPLNASTYAIVIHNVSGGDITIPLEPSELADGETIGFSAKFKTATGEATFTAAADTYITLNRTSTEGEATAIYVLDNFRVTDLTAPEKYEIIVEEIKNGTVEANHSYAEEGTEITFTVTPDEGYELDEVTVVDGEGTEITVTEQDGVYTFTMPASDVTITAAFKAIDYPVIVEKAENGTVTADKKTANIGDTVTLTVTADAGYELDELTATDSQGNPVEIIRNEDGTYSFTAPADEVTVAATFKAIGSDPTTPGTVTEDVEHADPSMPTISVPKGALVDAVLTEEEEELLASGTDIDIVLRVADISDSVSAEDKALVEATVEAAEGDYTIAMYLDVTLVKIIEEEETLINKTRKHIPVTIEVPEDLQVDGREFVIVRVHDGVPEILEDLVPDDGARITFETDRFSTYAIAYRTEDAPEKPTEEPTEKPTEKPTQTTKPGNTETPKTGDETPLAVNIAMLILSALSIVAVVYYKRRDY